MLDSMDSRAGRTIELGLNNCTPRPNCSLTDDKRSGQAGQVNQVKIPGQAGSGQFWLGNNKRRRAPVFPSSRSYPPTLLPACTASTASTPPHQTTKRRPESERIPALHAGN